MTSIGWFDENEDDGNNHTHENVDEKDDDYAEEDYDYDKIYLSFIMFDQNYDDFA